MPTPDPVILTFDRNVFDGIAVETPLVTWTDDQVDQLIGRDSQARVALRPWGELDPAARRAVFQAALKYLTRRDEALKDRKAVADQLSKLTAFITGEEVVLSHG